MQLGSIHCLVTKLLLFLWLIFFDFAIAESVDFGYVPHGYNPRLYDAELDPIVQLDQLVFDDTIYGSNIAYYVEFYADWCGHCRAFAPYFKEFAQSVRGWTPVMKVAAVNCADMFNERLCRQNRVNGFPLIKYFPRHSRSPDDGIHLKAFHSVQELRDATVDLIMNEYSASRPPKWPQFDFIPNGQSLRDLRLSAHAPYLLLFVQNYRHGHAGAKLLLDFASARSLIEIRRSMQSTNLAHQLNVANTYRPTIILFKRDAQTPILIEKFSQSGLNKVMQMLTRHVENATDKDSFQWLLFSNDSAAKREEHIPPVISCDLQPNRCRALYYVSETDMLKAMKQALYEEVPRIGGHLRAKKLTKLINFLGLLIHYFPQSTIMDSTGWIYTLTNSYYARQVFGDLRDWLRTKPSPISSREWTRKFREVEHRYGYPFPNKRVPWDHCRGSTAKFRGYTCGLWTTFHALTVGAYRSNAANPRFQPIEPLKAIQGWVDEFFGCRKCRDHFMNMTVNTFPMENEVKSAVDVFMYLWRAHNIVNQRLSGDATEDPQFLKRQFPANFLCQSCHYTFGQLQKSKFSLGHVHMFLLHYYSAIRPYQILRQ